MELNSMKILIENTKQYDMQMIVQIQNSQKNALETIQLFRKVADSNLNLKNKQKTTECLITGTFTKTYKIETFIRGVKITRKSIKPLKIYLCHDNDVC